MDESQKIVINGKEIESVDGWVSLRKLCQALGLDPARQREKAQLFFPTRKLKIHSYNGQYTQVCLSEKNAKTFVSLGGLWARGKYKRLK